MNQSPEEELNSVRTSTPVSLEDVHKVRKIICSYAFDMPDALGLMEMLGVHPACPEVLTDPVE